MNRLYPVQTFVAYATKVCRTGSWSQCMRTCERGLSMNRTSSARSLPLKAAEGRRTPKRWRVGLAHSNFRQVIECAPPGA